MKRRCTIFIIFILILSNIFFATKLTQINNLSKEDKVEHSEQKKEKGITIYREDNSAIINNMIKHIALAEETIEYVTMNDKETIIKLWADGVVNRNGVMQYAAMDNKLKNQFKQYLFSKDNTSWITGNDEVNISSYEIVEEKQVSEKVMFYKIVFKLINNGKEDVIQVNISVVKDGERWVIDGIWT